MRNRQSLQLIVFMVLIGVGIDSYSSSPFFPLTLKEGEQSLEIISRKGETFFVTNKRVFKREGSELKEIFHSDFTINDAVLDSSAMWLASDQGLYHLDLKSLKARQQELAYRFNDKKVVGLAKDASGKLWVGTSGSGVFQRYGNTFEPALEVSPVLSLAATPNRDIWVGTNVGLYRYRKSENNWTRYAEEGYSGYELPDNIIESLFPDHSSNVWVVMPDLVSFVSSGKTEGHLPSYNYVGKPNNHILHISDLGKGSYVFSTSDGLVYLPEIPEEHHHGGTEEVHSTPQGPKAVLVAKEQFRTPKELSSETITKTYVSPEGAIWFITARGIWSMSGKQFKKVAQRLAEKAL